MLVKFGVIKCKSFQFEIVREDQLILDYFDVSLKVFSDRIRKGKFYMMVFKEKNKQKIVNIWEGKVLFLRF